MNVLRKFDYRPLASHSRSDTSSDLDVEETKRFLENTHIDDNGERKSTQRTLVLLTVLNISILLLSSSLFVTWYTHQDTRLNAEYRRMQPFSPVHDLFNLDPKIKKINGTFYPTRDGGSIARHQPNPIDDKIWDEWELTRVYPVTRKDLSRMGIPSDRIDTVAKLENDVWGLGDDAYATIFDIYHQVHCLNSLRHIAYGDYYNMSMGRAQTIKQREYHINHCVDILLQSIQCSGNLDVMPLHWVETQEYPFPDMSINKQCASFDKLTEFRKANTIDMDKYVKVMKMPELEKPGIKQLPAADQYYEYWGYDNPNHKPKEEGGHGIALNVDNNL